MNLLIVNNFLPEPLRSPLRAYTSQFTVDRCASLCYNTDVNDTRRIMKLGKLIRHYRQEKGISQAELARRMAVSPSYMNLIEKGQRDGPRTMPRS